MQKGLHANYLNLILINIQKFSCLKVLSIDNAFDCKLFNIFHWADRNPMIWNGEFSKYHRKTGWKVGEKEKDPRLGSKGSEYFQNTAWMFGSLDPKQYQIIFYVSIFYVSNFCDYIWPL